VLNFKKFAFYTLCLCDFVAKKSKTYRLYSFPFRPKADLCFLPIFYRGRFPGRKFNPGLRRSSLPGATNMPPLHGFKIELQTSFCILQALHQTICKLKTSSIVFCIGRTYLPLPPRKSGAGSPERGIIEHQATNIEYLVWNLGFGYWNFFGIEQQKKAALSDSPSI
jgi:hypothetical protein